MDDFSDVTELSFVVDSDEEDFDEEEDLEFIQGSQGSALVMDLNLNQPTNHQPVDQLTMSQDLDFQNQDQVLIRPRLGSAQANIPEPCPQNVETEESTCSICLEPWTNSGSHRLVSIKCGHLYGESCIYKWIAQHSRDGNPKCPECNHPTKRKDVRRIWSKSVVVADTAERDEAVSRAKKEQESRIRCEQELANSRLAYEMLKSELAKLQKKHDREKAFKQKYRMELKRLNFKDPEKDITKRFSYVYYKPVNFPARPSGTSHYLSYRQDEEMLVCSRQVNEKHGIAKISMRDFSNNLHNIIPIHQQPIRDVQCYTADNFSNKSLVLTASWDQTLKITSAASHQTVLSYDLKAQVWSCCWSTSNPLTLYCSIKRRQSSILTLDLRNTSAPVATFNLTGHSPIHSMTHIGQSHSQRSEGIICGNTYGPFIYNFEVGTETGPLSQESLQSASQGSVNLENNDSCRTLRFEGAGCSSVSFDPESRHWMASYILRGKNTTLNVRGYLGQDIHNNNLLLNSEFKVSGGAPQNGSSRNTIFSRNDGSIHMASGSCDGTNLWYGKLVSHPLNSLEPATSELSISDDFVDHVVLPRHRRPENDTDSIKDVKSVVVGHDEYVATLTDKDLELFKWSERPEFLRLEDYETEDSDDDILGDIELYPKSTGGADKGKRRRTDDNGKPQSLENRMRVLSSLGPLSKVALHLEPFSIYVHWPYCSSKCTYCNFNKYVDPRADHERMERSLLKELEAEIKYWGLDNKTRPLRSVYFGDQLCDLPKGTEITMEGNPSELGRDHTPSSALRSLLDARSVWPGKVSMDLIMGHSGQTLEDWKQELRFTLDVVDDHLSLYHLTVEPGTQLHKDVTQGKVQLPDNELAVDMYEAMIEMTNEAGFEHYEVSNFARNGAYSQHNRIGPGAHGRMRDPISGKVMRTFNIRDPAGWMRQCAEIGTGRRRTTVIEIEETKQELVALGLRTKRGVELENFKMRTDQGLLEYLNTEATKSCIEAGLVTLNPQALLPTERGMAVADELALRLLP
ncbi:radical S-adenosyl methionine domain-containing protein 1 [Haplosporangium sp. Z 27]|nr:radical S-adenosyl methionine domain-containing protein 1 [Haplosporangium sp. Z 27]